MPVITDAQAPRFDAGGTHAVGLASPSRGAQSTSAWRVRLDPGTVSPEHTLDAEEVFVVLAGAATATLDGASSDVRGGDALIVPPGVSFALANRGDEAVRGRGLHARRRHGDLGRPDGRPALGRLVT